MSWSTLGNPWKYLKKLRLFKLTEAKFYVLIAGFMAITVVSCKSDDGGECTTCDSPETQSFQVCKDGDGNATVNGQDTNTDYDLYISDLIMAGASCGG